MNEIPEWCQFSNGGGGYRTVGTDDHNLCGFHEYLVNETPHTGGCSALCVHTCVCVCVCVCVYECEGGHVDS